MIARLALAAASGICLWLAFPAANLWPLAMVGVALQALALRGVRTRTGFAIGMVSGLACFAPVLHWTGIFVGSFPWLALSVTETLYVAAMAAALAFLQRDRIRPLAVALLWVTQEWVRGNFPFGGFPWVRLAWSQADSPLARLASIAGAPGLTFLVALIGGWLALSASRLVTRRRMASAWLPAVGAVLVVGVATAYPVPAAGTPLHVVGIQGNVPTDGLDYNSQRRAVLDNHVHTTLEAARLVRQGRITQPQLVVWPENSSDIDPTREADAATEILHATATINAPVIVGAVLDEPSPEVSNTSLLYLPGKGLTARYVKQRPVPFAEYIPYRSFFRFFSKKVDLVRADFTHGTKVGVFAIPTSSGTVKVGPIICFEVAYDDTTRAPVTRGARLLVVQTNNATFGRTAESEQQLAISRIRAIEHGRSIVHISTVGVSGLITPDGHVHDKTSLFTQRVLADALPLRSATTIADRLGAIPELLAVAMALLMVGAAATGGRRRRHNSEGS